MDYEQKYKNALKWMQSLYSGLHGTTKEDAEHYFPELKEKESEDDRMKKALKQGFFQYGNFFTTFAGIKVGDIIAWLEKQSAKKSANEALKIRQELYQNGYNDGYKHGYNHGQNNIAIALGKESIEALEHFVRSIRESGYASPYDNRTKLVYRLLEQLKQIVK